MAGVIAPRRGSAAWARGAPSSSPASSPACRSRARAGCVFASSSTTAAHPAGVPRLVALGWYAGFHEAQAQPRQALRAVTRTGRGGCYRRRASYMNRDLCTLELTSLARCRCCCCCCCCSQSSAASASRRATASLCCRSVLELGGRRVRHASRRAHSGWHQPRDDEIQRCRCHFALNHSER